MYVYRLYCGRKSENVKIVGVIDDNPALSRLNVYGFNVLGTIRQLEEIYQKYPFDTIVVTCKELSGGKLRRLQGFQKKYDVKLINFVCKTEEIPQ